MGVFIVATTVAAGNSQEAGGTAIRFDIPSQSLGSALEAYARISGREVLYNGALAAGHRSSAVEGTYPPVEALQTLLAGTGLTAEFKDADFFVLIPAPSAEGQARTVDAGPSALQLSYYSRIQAGLRASFCGKSNVLPGRYRVAVQLWIGSDGSVSQDKRLESTGDTALDADIDATLRGMRLGAPPPDGFTQPVTVVVMPDAPGVRRDCDEDDPQQPPAEAGP
jgi:hypothetical protein